MTSCSNDMTNNETSLTKNGRDSISETFLKFQNKECLKNAIENGTTRASLGLYGDDNFVSLMDKVKADDPYLNTISSEEKDYVLSNELSYYEMYGYDEILPNENFAKLLNSKGEIQVNDSVYRITNYGTLCANIECLSEMDKCYDKLLKDSVDFGGNAQIKLSPNVVLCNSFKKINFEQMATTRTNIDNVPSDVYKYYTSDPATFVGKLWSDLTGDRSVKHNEFTKGYRINGSLYDYDYLAYYESGVLVYMSKKRGGFFKKINGWKKIDADELIMSYKGITMVTDYKMPSSILASVPKNPVFVGNDNYVNVPWLSSKPIRTIDILGYDINAKSFYNLIKGGYKNAIPTLRKLLNHDVANDTRMVRFLTPTKAYYGIIDNQYDEYNCNQIRKVFNSGIKLFVSSDIISNPLSFNSAKDLYTGLRNIPVTNIAAGTVWLAANYNGKWGGLVIEKK